MVISATSLSYSGLRDWIIQRVTAVLLAVYTLILLVFFLYHPHPGFEEWHDFFSTAWMRLGTFLMLFGLVLHSWVGIWTVVTDYIKPPPLRLIVQALVALLLTLYLIWGVQLLWGVL